MKKFGVFAVVILAIINLGFSIFSKISMTKDKSTVFVPNIVVVKFKQESRTKLLKDNSIQESFNKVLASFGTTKLEKVFSNHQDFQKSSEVNNLSNIYYVTFSADLNPQEVAKELEKNPLVEYAEPKIIRYLCYSPNDVKYLTQWALYQMQMEPAWDISQGDTSVIIGIIDTGVDWTHPDLAANIWTNKGEIPNNGIDDDHNGYIDDVRGWDFGGNGNNNLPTPDNNPNEDRADHGTHVAGIASACTNNGIGVAGIGFNCKIMPVKTTQNNKRTNGLPDVLFGPEGIVYAADNGASIINCSWGGGGFSKYENDAVQYATKKGALVVAAAGNDGRFETIFTPASYDNVLAVASTGSNDQKAGHSNYGPYVGVSAPGVSILSTWFSGEYSYEDGTSMATPHAAGLAALVKSKFPGYSANQVRERVRVTADNIDNLNPNYAGSVGFGRINANRALSVSSPAVRILTYYFDDTTKGNANGLMEPGEKILIKMEFINYLDPTSNLNINLESKNPLVKIIKGNMNSGKIGTLGKVNNFSSPFEIDLDAAIPFDFDNIFVLKFVDGAYNDMQQIIGTVNSSYRQVQTSNIDFTIGSQGNLGFIDSPDNMKGQGFSFKKYPNILFEGALMFGTSETSVSNCARDANSGKDEHFKILKALSFSKTSNADNEGYNIFNDDLNPNKYNITTTLRTYAYQNAPYSDFVILSYTFKNNSANKISNFYGGLFFDWDVSFNADGHEDISKFDKNNNIGYIYDATGVIKAYAGITVLNNTEKINFSHILNDSQTGWQIYDGFTTSEKYFALHNNVNKNTDIGPGDISQIISAGPFDIPAGESVTVTFAVLSGENLSDLQLAKLRANEKLLGIKVAADPLKNMPITFSLNQNYPNPFNPMTTISFSIREQSNIIIKIFDIRGSLVKELFKNNLPPGQYEEPVNLSYLSSGVYYYQLQAYNNKGSLIYNNARKMTLLK